MNRERTATTVAGLLAFAMLTGCGTVTKGTTQVVAVTSSPTGAKFIVLPSGQTGVTPAELKLDRKGDHTFKFTHPDFAPRKAYVRRMLAGSTMHANAASCLVLPFICLIWTGVDDQSGGQFELQPDPLHVELLPKSAIDWPTMETKVVFFNGNTGGAGAGVGFSVDGGSECELNKQQFTTRVLSAGTHEIKATHWDLANWSGSSLLDIDGADVFVAVFTTATSTQAAFANELPVGFEETCMDAPVTGAIPAAAEPSAGSANADE